MTDTRARAAQLWCLPQHASKPMDVEFAESIALALADERQQALEEAAKVLRRATVSLVAAVSLLEQGGKQAAPSNKMFSQMLRDYKKAIEDAKNFDAQAHAGPEEGA